MHGTFRQLCACEGCWNEVTEAQRLHAERCGFVARWCSRRCHDLNKLRRQQRSRPKSVHLAEQRERAARRSAAQRERRLRSVQRRWQGRLIKPYACDWCGAVTWPRPGSYLTRSGHRICSRKCARHLWRKHNPRSRGDARWVISLQEICERDRWVCHLCGDMVTLDTASRDHVVPVSRGGPNTADNLRLAHLSCNARRKADPIGVGP
jgi:ribosomal protein L24E